MLITEIERIDNKKVEWSETVVILAEQAETVLGYSVLKEQQTPKTDSESALYRILCDLGIETLKDSDVHKYQLERRLEQSRIRFDEWQKNPELTFIGSSWERMDIERYKEPIPEFVLNKAIQIKQAMPEVRIYVEHLTDFPDPFLIVATRHKEYKCMDGEVFYVEVWEEPKFEGRIR